MQATNEPNDNNNDKSWCWSLGVYSEGITFIIYGKNARNMPSQYFMARWAVLVTNNGNLT
jgi:hypothetical protein